MRRAIRGDARVRETSAIEPERQFYTMLWSTERWGSAQPNGDERRRAATIARFIETSVRPALLGAGRLRILDLGCGRGWLTAMLGAYGQVVGVDPVPEAIQRARQLHSEMDVRAGVAADLLSSLGPGYFDLVVSSEVIEHVPGAEQESFLREIYELLIAGGFAILTTPRGELWNSWQRFHPSRQPIEEWLTERDLNRLCRSVGFHVIARERVFVPDYRHCFTSRLLQSRLLCQLTGRFPETPILAWLRHRAAIYQAILLQRPHSA